MCHFRYLLLRLCSSSRVEREAIMEGEVWSDGGDGWAIWSHPYYWYVVELALFSPFFYMTFSTATVFQFYCSTRAFNRTFLSFSFDSFFFLATLIFYSHFQNYLPTLQISPVMAICQLSQCVRDLISRAARCVSWLPFFYYPSICLNLSSFAWFQFHHIALPVSTLTNVGHWEAQEGEGRGLPKGILRGSDARRGMCRHEGTFVIIGLHWLYLLVCAQIRVAQPFFLPPNVLICSVSLFAAPHPSSFLILLPFPPCLSFHPSFLLCLRLCCFPFRSAMQSPFFAKLFWTGAMPFHTLNLRAWW